MLELIAARPMRINHKSSEQGKRNLCSLISERARAASSGFLSRFVSQKVELDTRSLDLNKPSTFYKVRLKLGCSVWSIDELLGSTSGADSVASGQHCYDDDSWGALLAGLRAALRAALQPTPEIELCSDASARSRPAPACSALFIA